jgi:hypothetical protein
MLENLGLHEPYNQSHILLHVDVHMYVYVLPYTAECVKIPGIELNVFICSGVPNILKRKYVSSH